MNLLKKSDNALVINRIIGSFPEKYKGIGVGSILITKTDINSSHPYILIVGFSNEDDKYDHIKVWSYTYHKDIGKSKKECGEYLKEENIHLDSFKEYYLGKTMFVVKNASEISDLIDNCEDIDLEEYSVGNTQGDALVHIGSTSHLESMKMGIEQKVDQLSKISGAVHIKLFEQKRKLNLIKQKFDSKLSLLKQEVGRIKKIIWTIELYLGIKESVVQINEGEPAKAEEVLKLFQTCSYMDEEVANPEDQGIDMNNIGKFDEWICKHNSYHNKKNYELIMYPRSLLMFKVRRKDKKYTSNPIINSLMNANNHKTYILIRNGDNLYRIWANINISKFFPDKDEFEKIGVNSFSSNTEEDLHNMKRDAFIHYQRHFIMLQGLIDRTEIFNPMPKLKISEEFSSGKIEYLYTNNIMLPTEKPSFHEWLSSINKHLKQGSRFVWSGGCSYNQDRFSEQFYSYRRDKNDTYGLPNPPSKGIYTIDNVVQLKRVYYSGKKETFIIKIDNIKDWEFGHPQSRKKISYKVYPDEDGIINYDLCSLTDIDYYTHSREDRKNYLSMMPILIEIKKWLLRDKELEYQFTQMMLGKLHNQNIPIEEWRVLKAISWWKTKNKWKRSVTSDDSKAMRMIEKHIISEYNKLKI